MVSERLNDLLTKTLVWFEVNGLFAVNLHLCAVWEVQPPAPWLSEKSLYHGKLCEFCEDEHILEDAVFQECQV